MAVENVSHGIQIFLITKTIDNNIVLKKTIENRESSHGASHRYIVD